MKNHSKKITPLEIGPVTQWTESLQALYDALPLSLGKERLYYFQQELSYRLIPSIRHWDQDMLMLFQIRAALFVLEKAETIGLDRFTFYQRSKMTSVLETCEMMIKQAIEDIRLKQLGEEKYSRVLSDIALLIHPLAMNEQLILHANWFYIYIFLWGRLFINRERIGEEQKRLNDLFADPELPPLRKSLVLRALAHLDFIMQDDAAALEKLNRLPRPIEFSDYGLYLNTLLRQRQRTRLLQWLHWRLPRIKEGREEEIVQFLKIWEKTSRTFDLNGEYEQVLRQLLPHSYYQYSARLLERKQYRLWIDLHMSLGFYPSDVEPADLKRVEDEDMNLLLPFYHHAVEAHIATKNRTGYRQAVSCLKKLHSFYEHLGKNAEWQAYIQLMLGRYRRLRAFQEELRKGRIA